MPKLQDIEQFKASLKSLGKETEVLARWGETWQNMEAPPQGVPDDIASLLEADSSGDYKATDTQAAGIDADFASFLEDLSLADHTDTTELPPAPGQAAVDEFELPAAFTEEPIVLPEEPTILPEESMIPPDEPTVLSDEPTSFSDEPTQAAEDDQFPSGLPPDALLDDFASLAEIEPTLNAEAIADAEAITNTEPEEIAELEPEEIAELEPEETSGASDFGTEDFSVPESLLADFGETAGLSGLDTVPEETFGLDDLKSFSAESPAQTEEAPGEAFSMDFGLPEEPGSPPGVELGGETTEGDAFDQFDLDAALGGASPTGASPNGASPDNPAVPDMGSDDFSAALGLESLGGDLGSLDGEAQTADTFSIDSGWGADFTIPGFEMGGEAATPSKKAPKTDAAASLSGAFGVEYSRQKPEKQARPVDLSDHQVDTLQDTLLSYPLNLRLAIEDIIANTKGSETQQSDLIWMLVEGATPRDASKLAGRILKRYIEVPSEFTKRTGAAFEADKGSFRYIFIHSILPVLQMLVLVAAAAGALFYLGYTFAYRPLKANSLYSEGLRQLEQAKYGESMAFFDRADREWSMKRWHYRYAEAFAKAGQYPRAEAMYDRLLYSWPKETQAALDYARMEMDTLAFSKASSVLQTYILDRLYFDKRALAMSASNYLSWADFEEQRYEGPDKQLIGDLHEKARLQLATLMERHGRTDAYLELMLLYLIRSEKLGHDSRLMEILSMTKYLVDNKKTGWSASTLAELGEYLLDHEETENVNSIALRAVDRDGSLPEAHLLVARWNRLSGFPADELQAMEFAARFFAEDDAKAGLTTKRNKRYMESLIRLGELRRAAGKSLDAEDAFNLAIKRYERALAGRQIKRTPVYGKAYASLADIYYAERMDFTGALAFYAEAERNGYTTADNDYHQGYIHYMQATDDGSSALKFFYRATLDTDPSPYLQWATANALFLRGDYFAAQGYYSMLAKRLQFELDTITLPSPQTKPSHGEIVELLMMTRNNLGVSMYRVAERMGNARRRAEAMVEFTESARLFDSIARDQKTMIRPESKNLGFLNLDFVLHPMRGIDLGFYKSIPVDMDYPRR